MDFKAAFLSFGVICVLAFAIQVFIYSPISPDLLQLPQTSHLPPFHSKLQQVTKLGKGILLQPEDTAVDKSGILYTATRDGWIKRQRKDGSWENWKHIDADGTFLVGITFTAAGDIIACDCSKGLYKVNEDGVTLIVSHVNGTKISFANDVVEASDGSLYFTTSTNKYGVPDWYMDVLEAKPHGQLLKFDPSTKETSVLIDGLAFAAGVALSKDQSYLVVCEMWKFRCLKYWLKEEIKGKTEIFVDNLPGGPDNINLAPDGSSFWIALLEISPPRMRFVHRLRVLKCVVATFPKLIEWVNGVFTRAMVVKVSADGRVVEAYDDPTGEVVSLVTSALEFEGNLYLGSLSNDFIAKLPLESAKA